MKRVVAFLLSTVMILCAIFACTGCNKKKIHIYTRSEWISAIAELFHLTEPYGDTPYFDDVGPDSAYYHAVQTCAEWEIIDKSKHFDPKKRADVNFAIVTAVKAVGLDRIAKATEGAVLKTDGEIIEYFNGKCDIKYIPGSSLYMDTAESILQDLGRIYSTLQLKQYQNIEYKDHVLFPETSDIVFSADGETAKIRSGSYDIGDIICFEPSVSYPEGKYAKITSIQGDLFRYTEPAIEDIAENISVYGTYDLEILGIIPLMDGIEVESIGGGEAQYRPYDSDGLHTVMYVSQVDKTFKLNDVEIKFADAELKSKDGSASIQGVLKVKDIWATVDFDMAGPILKKAAFTINDTIEASVSVEGKIKKTFEIAKVPCKLFGILGANLVLAAKVNADGNMDVVWSVDTSQSVEYKPFTSPKFYANGSNAKLDVELNVKMSFKPEFKADFVVGKTKVATIGAYSGLDASAKGKLIDTNSETDCVDIHAYVPLTIFVGAETEKGNDTLLGKLGVKYIWNIWNAKNSPIRKDWHVENLKIVPKCTQGRDAQDSYDGDNEAVEDNTEIDDAFINHIVEYDELLEISSYYIILAEGSGDTLEIASLPDGYTASELIFSSSDNSVATVNENGFITAVHSGSCLIKVRTTDGEYEQSCSVRVFTSYDVEFTPLSCLI